ncbi:unnamed protein product [Microthlaspi erraticum]|uniref:F-box domain-containing protein n=1 Tax=Microthlaspi erraticum TaxID=1685480 RepID=A0A6D2JZG0_9BRAS|nr:unnamed protein product [Microthlaspi erraticum]
MTTLRELPGDLVEEILCRVPAKSVKRLRSTCKRWNRLFNDVGFARKHSDKAPKQFIDLVLTAEYKILPMSVNLHGINPSVEFKGELSLPDHPHSMDVDGVFHCDGFILCTYTSRDEYGIVVWNPCTGQTRRIDPVVRNKSRGFALGYHQDKGKRSYKLLSYYDTLKDSAIYDFTSDSWKIVDGDIAPGWNVGDAYSCQSASLKGNTYWFANHETETHLGMCLLRFDYSTKISCGHVPLPYQYPSYRTSTLSVVREEKLSVLLQPHNTSKTEVWVTDKIDGTKDMSWRKS